MPVKPIQPKVSAVVPVFRPGNGLSRCIASLRGQTLKDIEIIFVDDCGGTGSLELLRAAAKEDPRVRVIENPENLGSGPSRNRGMEAARGEYLSFVDPDDYLAPNFYELLYAKAIKTGAGIVKGSRFAVYENGEPAPRQGGSLSSRRIRYSLRMGDPLWRRFTCEHQSAIYLRAAVLSSGACYGISRLGQDITFLLRYCASGPSIAFADKAVYYYVVRKGSAVRTVSSRRFEFRLDAFREQMDTLAALHESDPKNVRLHIMRRVEALASEGLYLKRVTGDQDAAARHFAEARTLVLRFFDANELVATGPAFHALVEHRIPLARRAYSPTGELPYAVDWPPIIAEWIRFADTCTHDQANVHRNAVRVLRRALFALAHEYGLRGTDDEFETALNEIRRQLVASPSRRALCALDPRLALFVAGGPTLLFGVTQRTKDAVKKVLWRLER